MGLKRGIKELVAEADAVVTSVPAAEAVEAHGSPDLVYVDVRDVRELDREGMVPDAVHAPRGMLEFWVDPDSPYHKEVFAQEDKTFVLYCQSGWRSALAAKTLQEMGMDNVEHITGGFKAWCEADGPVAERPSRKR